MRTTMLAGVFAAWVHTGCGTSACDQSQSWRNEPSSVCQACLAQNCAMQQSAEINNASTCSPQYACVMRCPMGSATSCGCIESCLVTDACKSANDALVTCAVGHCSTECQ